MKRSVKTSDAPQAIGPYSQAIVAAGLVHCSGQIALDPKTGSMVEGDVAVQARRALENLTAVLRAADSALDRVVKCNVYLRDMNDFAAVNEVYEEYFGGTDSPARATVEVSRLPKDAAVEIDCIALQ